MSSEKDQLIEITLKLIFGVTVSQIDELFTRVWRRVTVVSEPFTFTQDCYNTSPVYLSQRRREESVRPLSVPL